MTDPTIEHVQTKREIEAVLSRAGIRPLKRFGQHFLIDGNLMRRLVEAAELSVNDIVLEVGGGTGGLTDLLIRRAGRVVCVEIDKGLHAILTERFQSAEVLTLIQGDALESKHRLSAPVATILGGRAGTGVCAKLVANLPYQAATPLVMDLLLDYPQVRRLCFTVQAEVGERMLSPSGRKAYGPLSILSQLLCDCRVVARLPPEAFWPRPTVDSVMLRLDVKDPPPFADREELHRFAALVRSTFDHRRKTLRQALAYRVDDVRRDRACAILDGTRRPESFSVAEWVCIHSILNATLDRSN